MKKIILILVNKVKVYSNFSLFIRKSSTFRDMIKTLKKPLANQKTKKPFGRIIVSLRIMTSTLALAISVVIIRLLLTKRYFFILTFFKISRLLKRVLVEIIDTVGYSLSCTLRIAKNLQDNGHHQFFQKIS